MYLEAAFKLKDRAHSVKRGGADRPSTFMARPLDQPCDSDFPRIMNKSGCLPCAFRARSANGFL